MEEIIIEDSFSEKSLIKMNGNNKKNNKNVYHQKL